MATPHHTRARTPPPSARPPIANLAPRDVAALADELGAYHAPFAPLFRRAEQRRWAQAYLAGQLLDLERKSIEPIALAVEGGNVQALQQFIGVGAWDDEAILATAPAAGGGDAAATPRPACSSSMAATSPSRATTPSAWRANGAARWARWPTARPACSPATPAPAATRWSTGASPCRSVVQRGVPRAARALRYPGGRPRSDAPGAGLGDGRRAAAAGRPALPLGDSADEHFGVSTPLLLDRWPTLGLRYFTEVPHNMRVWLRRPATAVPPAEEARPPAAPAPRGARRAGGDAGRCPGGALPAYVVAALGGARRGAGAARGGGARLCARWRCATACPARMCWVVLRRRRHAEPS